MSRLPSSLPTPFRSQEHLLALLIGGLGVLVYFGLAALPWQFGRIYDGTLIYNYYFLSLIEGAFNIPVRIIGAEGHYDETGRAFIYHGLAPLITRALAWPFVDLTRVSLTPVTIWLFAALGTALYHVTAFRILHRFGPSEAGARTRLVLLMSVMVWLASPGPILAVNGAFYHEPFAITYAACAGVVAMLIDIALFGAPGRKWLIPCAVLAGITLHARPDMAVGLYAGVCLMAGLVLWRDGAGALAGVIGAMAVLGAFGGLLLGVNAFRFGTPWRMHGATGHGVIEYGILFWEIEPVTSPRLVALAEHGTFNLHRILPNAMLYLADMPYGPPSDWLRRAFRAMTEELGFIRIGRPRLGMIFYWAPWCLLAAISLRYLHRIPRYGWVLLIATGLGAVLMLSYGTVTLRYRFNLWPVIAAMALLGLPHCLQALAALQDRRHRRGLASMAWITALSVAVMALLLFDYHFAYVNLPTGNVGPWTFAHCAEMVRQAPALSPSDIDRICSL